MTLVKTLRREELGEAVAIGGLANVMRAQYTCGKVSIIPKACRANHSYAWEGMVVQANDAGVWPSLQG